MPGRDGGMIKCSQAHEGFKDEGMRDCTGG